MLANLNDVLPLLNREKICLPAFDIAGGQPDFLLGVLRACETAGSPACFLIWCPGAVYLELEAAVDLVRFYAGRSPVPVILHLDHGSSPEIVSKGMELGFSSVMFDGSALPLAENIRLTKEMVREARARGISIEGEIGNIGSEHAGHQRSSVLTDPREAEEFAKATDVDFLAPSVGNAHGFYKEPPRLRFELIEEIGQRSGKPLSLHGGTGIPMEDLRKAAGLGVRKLNVATMVHKVFTDSLNRDPDPAGKRQSPWRDILNQGRRAVSDLVENYLKELHLKGITKSSP
jgi:ketose-bisphosphate aldolase